MNIQIPKIAFEYYRIRIFAEQSNICLSLNCILFFGGLSESKMGLEAVPDVDESCTFKK